MADPSDVEGQERRPLAADGAHGGGVGGRQQNPYSNLPPTSSLPPNHWFYKLKRSCILGLSLWGLHELRVWHAVLRAPDVGHGWFKAGLAASVAILAMKGYMELYQGKVKGVRVEYKNFRNATHALILLIGLATVCFYSALSPHYGGAKTMLVLMVFGWGVLVPLSLLLPTYVQNAVAAVLMTFFLQQYQ